MKLLCTLFVIVSSFDPVSGKIETFPPLPTPQLYANSCTSQATLANPYLKIHLAKNYEYNSEKLYCDITSYADTTAAQIFISYPYNSAKINFHLFFNRKLVHSLKNGQRLLYTTSTYGLLKLTLLRTTDYADPPTLARNTRSISVKKGKVYYFEVGASGEITYIVNTDKGKEKFNDPRNFAGPPATLSEIQKDTLVVN